MFQKLFRKVMTLKFRTGLDANIANFAKQAVQGEPALATDSKRVFIATSDAGSSDSSLTEFQMIRGVTAVAGASHSVAKTDRWLKCTGTGTQTVNLPAVTADMDGETHTVKKTASGGQVDITANGTDTIDGNASVSLSAQHKVKTLVCDGTGWIVVQEN